MLNYTFSKIKDLIFEKAPHRIDDFYEYISVKNSSKLSDQSESEESSNETDDVFDMKIQKFHKKLSRNIEKELETNLNKSTKKGNNLDLNLESDIIITNNTKDLEQRMKNLENRLNERMTKLSIKFKNYRAYQKKSDKSKEIIQQINSFKNKLNHFELLIMQNNRTQNVKINNQTETISILQNELEAIRRGLGDLHSYNESQRVERNRSNAIGILLTTLLI